MNGRVLPLIVGSLLLLLGCGGPSSPPSPPGPSGNDDALLVLQPSQLCSEQPEAAIATFEDASLEARVRAALYLGEHDDLTCRWVSVLTGLGARSLGSTSLVGLQNLTSLTFLDVYRNSISDIGALSGLTSLRLLHFGYNSITDISPLSGLTSLRFLHLDNNPDLTDIQPLLDNTGLGEGDTVDLTGTSVSCTDVTALRARGVTVVSPC